MSWRATWRGQRWPVAAAICASFAVAALLASCGGSGDAGENGSTPAAVNPGGPANPINPGGVAPSSLPPAVSQAKDASTAVDPELVSADNAFGLNLLNTLIPANAGGNIAIAPISVAMAFQIVYNGAAGSTQQAMAGTLQLNGMSVPTLNNDNAALLASLVDPDPQVAVTVANSLWLLLSDNKVLPSFIDADQTYYGAQVGDLAGAPADVNAWVAAQTNGLITQILPAGNYANGQTAAVIANVVYFKGQWSSPFNSQQTTAAPFTLADGTQTSAQMMQQTASYAYLQGANFQAVSMPYGQGRLSMLAVLPSAGVDITSFVSSITADDIDSWVGQLKTTSVGIALPRFTATYSTPTGSLPTALTTLGMGIAFDRSLADFSGICARCYLSDAEHETVVEVDETGTVAAGATTTTIGITAVQAPAVTVTLNRPFFYAIRDNLTGDLLFVGILMNPG